MHQLSQINLFFYSLGDTHLGFASFEQNIRSATKGDYGFLGNKPGAKRAYGR
jgi:hypothetical protein